MEEASEGLKALAESVPPPPPAAADPPDDPAVGATMKRRRRLADSRVQFSGTVAADSSRPRGRTRASVSGDPGIDLDGESEKGSFRAGDLVWGKLANNTWWPGKVVDPLGYSWTAKKPGEGGHVLVVFFGDGSESWLKPSQLKLFKEEFKGMVKRSSSKGFAAAVTEALAEVKKMLESEIGTLLLPSVAVEGVANSSVGKYALDVPEFLDLLLIAARDVSSVNMLEVAMMSSWLMAFDSQNKHPLDIVEKEALNWGDDKLEEEQEVAGAVDGLSKRAELLDESKQKRKERSIAELIANKDSEIKDQNDEHDDAVVLDKLDQAAPKSRKRKKSTKNEHAESEISDAEKKVHVAIEKKATELGNNDSPSAAPIEQTEDVNSKSSCVDKGEAEAIEQAGHSRRERKKSKYLSPPYSSVSGHSKCIASSKDEPVEISGKCNVSLDGSPPNQEGNQNQEENKSALIFKYSQISVAEILSKFLSAAADPLCLKWNRSDKMVRNFISMFRDFAYSDGPNFLSYNNEVDVLGSGHTIHKRKDLDVGSQIRKDFKKRIKLNDGITGESSVNPSENLTPRNGTSEISKRRKISKDNTISETPQLDQNIANFSKKVMSGKLRKTRKSVDDKRGDVDISHGLSNSVERDPLLISKGKIAANSLTRDDPSGPSKRRKSESKSNGEAILKSNQKRSTGSEEINSGNKESRRMFGSPASLVLTYVPGTSLPSKEELISIHSAYGALVESDIQVLEDSHSIRFVFKRLSDAKKAVKSLYAGESLPSSIAKYELHKPVSLSSKSQRTSGSKTPLPYIKNNLEKMISKLSGFTPTPKDERISNQLDPEVRDTLVGEMNSLLKMVDKLLTRPSSDN